MVLFRQKRFEEVLDEKISKEQVENILNKYARKEDFKTLQNDALRFAEKATLRLATDTL